MEDPGIAAWQGDLQRLKVEVIILEEDVTECIAPLFTPTVTFPPSCIILS